MNDFYNKTRKLLELDDLIEAKEGEQIEFKAAANSFEFDELAKYASAIANCGGGHIVLGVSDKRPRKIVGSKAFPQPERTRAGLMNKLGLGIDFYLLEHEGNRVLVFDVPIRPVGFPIQYKGIAWWRVGDSIVEMPMNVMRSIFAESGHDFSADICEDAIIDDLDADAIEVFRSRWIDKSDQKALLNLSQEQILIDCEAIVRGKLTYAALILFGKREALGRLLGQAEVIFEYRSLDVSGPAQQREEFRLGFFMFYDRLWELINLRNNKQHYQDGLFVWDVPAFDVRVIREVILNAISHRNYQLGGSIIIRQYPHHLIIDSPGGFPPEITLDNILDRQSPRNRRIAEICARCGLVERSGQGMNLIYELNIQQAKLLPDFAGTDRSHVCISLDGLVQDPQLLTMMGRIGMETLQSFNTADFLVVHCIHKEQKVPTKLQDRLKRLLDLGIIERIARGRFILGKRYYVAAGKQGVYTRKRGLDRETNKALLLKHIRENTKTGSQMNEFYQVLPGLSRSQIQVFLRELKADGRIYVCGSTNAARWFVVI